MIGKIAGALIGNRLAGRNSGVKGALLGAAGARLATRGLGPLGRIGDDPKKKTVLICGHYDVQPVVAADPLVFPALTFVIPQFRPRRVMGGTRTRSSS